jgi:virginiamycin A acetyltransferase
MLSTLFGQIKLRLLDKVLAVATRPNRIDVAASVSPLARVTSSSLHGPVRIDDFARMYRAELSGPIHIGKNTSLWGPGIFVYARDHPISIGNFCSVARDVIVHGYYHDATRISTYFIGRNVLGRPIEEEIVSRGPIRIGHDVWIGAGVHVMSDVTIGNGAVIGAGSVVSRAVPAYAIAVGSPAAVVRFRFDAAVIQRLEASRWWEWSHEEIRARDELFTGPLTPELLDKYL